jgi:hypothetical protein
METALEKTVIETYYVKLISGLSWNVSFSTVSPWFGRSHSNVQRVAVFGKVFSTRPKARRGRTR